MRLFCLLFFSSISIYCADRQGQFFYGNKSITSLKSLSSLQSTSLSPQAATLLAGYHERKALESKKKMIRSVVNDSPYSLYVADLNQDSSEFDKNLKPRSQVIWDRCFQESSHIRFQFYTLTPTKDQPSLGILQGKSIDCHIFAHPENLQVHVVQNGAEKFITLCSNQLVNIKFTKQDQQNKVAFKFF